MEDKKHPIPESPTPDELDLESILREFGSGTSADVPEEPAEIPVEPNEVPEDPTDIPAQPADTPQEPADTPPPADLGDTLVLPNLGDTVVMTPLSAPMDTVVLDPAQIRQAAQNAAADGDTVRFQPITDTTVPSEAEPYSETWEPEYDEPMGEFVPPRPILIHPRSRLRELKRKLVAGPEKRYYSLSEIGLGRLQASIFLTVLVVVLSLVAVGLHKLDMVQENRLRLLVFGEILAMLLCALIGCYRLLDGLANLLRGRFTMETLLVVTFGVCIADAVACLEQLRVPYCAAFCVEMLFAQLAAYHRRTTELAQMDTLRKATNLHAFVTAPDVYEGQPGITRRDGEVEDFMDHYAKTPLPQHILHIYSLCAIALTLAAAIVTGYLHGWENLTRMWAAGLLCAVPGSALILYTRPMALLQKRLHRVGAVLCGWQGIRSLRGKLIVPLEDADLFPAGTIKMNGVKFYGETDPDEILALTTAVICGCGSSLGPIFTALLDSRSGSHYTATELRSYPGGVSGEVDGIQVLLGNANLLREMGIELPQGTKLGQAVYAAIDGELAGVFALSYSRERSSVVGLTTLMADRRISTVLATRDFMLSDKLLQNRFRCRIRRMLFPEAAAREEVLAKKPPEDTPAAVLCTNTSLAGSAYAITGARALRLCTTLGLVVHLAAGILGLCAVAILGILGSMELVTPASLLLYCLLWTIPGVLLTEWTRFA